jgi:peptidoglycan hydrolase-like protein with peptidoglycan-binding domain
MALRSKYFRGDPQLESASRENRFHILMGAQGLHVEKIQQALMLCDESNVEASEIASRTYGPSTAAAVLRFKKKRNIVNRSYQTQADAIVGIYTIQALDNEMFALECSVRSEGVCCRLCAGRSSVA